MDNYFILSNLRNRPKFEAHFNCVLINKDGLPTPNPFNELTNLPNLTFRLKVLCGGSEVGVLRDKLSVSIQNNERLFVVSSKLKKTIVQLGDKVEFHAVILLKDEEEILEYNIVNLLQSKDAIDYQDSRLVYWDEFQKEIYNIDKLVLDEDAIPDSYNIFILENIRGSVIVVSEKFKSIIEENKISGIKFSKIDEYVL